MKIMMTWILAMTIFFMSCVSSNAMADEVQTTPKSDEVALDETAKVSSETPAIVTSKLESKAEGTTWSEPVFGRYHIQLNFHNNPVFDDGLKYYNKLYGKASRYGTIGADYTPWGWFVNFGFGLRSSIFTDSGKAASGVSASTGEVTLDDNGKTSLTLIPFQFLGVARFTPFTKKWIVLEGYVGRERMYFQEVRTVKATSIPVSGSASSSGITGDKALTNKGWLSGNVTGAAVSILLNPLDERSVRSMANSMGLGFTYLTLFKEQVTYLDKDRVSFGRSSSGIGFTFETVK